MARRVKVGDDYKFKVVKDDSKPTFQAAATATEASLQDKAIMVLAISADFQRAYLRDSKPKLQVMNWVQSPGDSADERENRF
jgi:hypothetical protein